MEKKILNQKLIKSLINSDFFLIERQKIKKQIHHPITLTNSINKKQKIIALDPFEIAKDLKQLVRIFHLLKKSKQKIKLNFFFDTENTILTELIELAFKNKNFISKNILISLNPHKATKKKGTFSSPCSNVGFIIDQFQNNNFLKKQIKKKIRLFFLLNPDVQTNFDCYNIYNNVGDYKKALYFLSFLKQTLLNINR